MAGEVRLSDYNSTFCLLALFARTALWGSSADANRVMDKVRLSPRGRSAQQRLGSNSITSNQTIDIRKRSTHKKSRITNQSQTRF